MAGAAFVTAYCAVVSVLHANSEGRLPVRFTALLATIVVVCSALVGCVLTLSLSLKDVVHRRMSRGDPVNPILRLYFGMGIWSLVAWFPTVLVIGLLVTMATL